MSHLDTLRAGRTTPQAIWLLFLGDYRAGTTDIYLFVEGQSDLSYYLHVVRQFWRERGEVSGYNCNGRDNVISVMPRVKETLDLEWRGLFFIDRDIEQLCGCENPSDRCLFETDHYSIENYLVCEETVTVIWTELIRLPRSDARFGEIRAEFNEASASFNTAMKSVMAWIIYLRRQGNKVILNDVNMERLLMIDSKCRCALSNDWAEHIAAASNTRGVAHAEQEIASIMKELDELNAKAYIRGKFELWWFMKFLNNVMLPKGRERPSAEQPAGTYKLGISAKTAVDVLAPRLSPPPSLLAFLSRIVPAQGRQDTGRQDMQCMSHPIR